MIQLPGPLGHFLGQILHGNKLANFEATFSRFGMVIGCNDTYRMIIMIRMMKTQNGHNSANFEGKRSGFCMVINLNVTYMMMTMMMIMMMKMKITKTAIIPAI